MAQRRQFIPGIFNTNLSATRLERPYGNKRDGFCIYKGVKPKVMKPKKLEEIAEHGRPVSFRKAIHKSKKVYDRKHLKKAGINSDDLPFKPL